MATKKAAPKKAAKAAAPAKKAPAKKPAPAKNAKPAPAKAAPKKAAEPAKKAAPQKSSPAVAKKVVAKPAPKKAAPAPKKAAPAPKKAAPEAKKAAPAVKKVATPEKKAPAKAAAPKAASPKAAEPVKKPAVAAPTQQEVKPAIKPLEKPAPKKAEAPKPIVIPKTSTTKSVKYEPDFTKSVLDSKPQGQTGPTMRYSDAELMEFRELIQKKLDSAKKELAYLQGLITRKDESGDLDEGRYMTMEDGSMSMEREQLSQMASRQIQFIDHLEKAIMRIENKTYGVCRVTGKLIDKARLRAVPHATLSIEAKQMMNK
jgi:RNA polymerase-binding transcription factor DksA